jgi:hypothetical protein
VAYLDIIKRKNDNCIGHISRRNCLLKHVIEGKIEERIEVTGRRGRRLEFITNLMHNFIYKYK